MRDGPQAILDIRLETCRKRAAELGWEFAGEWVDEGENALTNDHRPRFDGMCAAMAQYAGQRPVHCLVEDWDRIARDGVAGAVLRRRVSLADGDCETAHGENDTPAEHARGLLTTPALTVAAIASAARRESVFTSAIMRRS